MVLGNSITQYSGIKIWQCISVAPLNFKILWISEIEKSEIWIGDALEITVEHSFSHTPFWGVCVCVCVFTQHVYIFHFPHLASALAPASLAVLCQEYFSLFIMEGKEMK